MDTKQFLAHIRRLIAGDHIQDALVQLREFFRNSPRLNEVLVQSARYEYILKQIRLGTADRDVAIVEKNRVTLGLLELLNEIEPEELPPGIREEANRAASGVAREFNLIVGSKNVVTNTTFESGSQVRIGDDYVQTESGFSRRLRFALFILVPLLAAVGAYYWYYANVLKQPLNLKVLIENGTSNPELAEPSGRLTLIYGGKSEVKEAVGEEAIFENIPASFKEQPVRLKYVADGFIPVDTTFPLDKAIHIQVRRNEDLARIKGLVSDESGDPLEGVKVSTSCCTTLTDPSGNFVLDIPFSDQRNQQRVNFYKPSYQTKDLNTPVIPGELLRIILTEK